MLTESVFFLYILLVDLKVTISMVYKLFVIVASIWNACSNVSKSPKNRVQWTGQARNAFIDKKTSSIPNVPSSNDMKYLLLIPFSDVIWRTTNKWYLRSIIGGQIRCVLWRSTGFPCVFLVFTIKVISNYKFYLKSLAVDWRARARAPRRRV